MSQKPQSNKVPALYSYSAWAVVCSGVLMLFALTPWSKQIGSLPGIKPFLYLLGGVVGLAVVPALVIILLGMMIFCVREDHSPLHVKIFWFIVFFATGWFGAAVYFFTVYRRQVQDAISSATQSGVLTTDRPETSADIPAQLDQIAGISRHAIAESPNEDEMKRMPSFLLRAKHWQLFLSLAAPLVTMQILGLSFMSISVSSWHELAARDYIVMAIWELTALCVLAWLGSIGLFLRSIERPELRMRARFFCISIAMATLYFVIVIPSQVCKASVLATVAVPLGPLWLVGMLYIIYFVSKNLVMAERGSPVSFDQYIGWFFLLWFFPIGIWIIQPKVNRLFRSQVISR